jgi:ketosteroid isomerase-like protein
VKNCRITFVVVLWALSGLANAACQPQVNVGLTEEDATALRQAFQAQLKAANGADSAGWAAWYVDDAMLLPPDGPAVQGRAEIQKWLAGLPPISNAVAQAEEIAGRGDLAYIRGSYSMTMTPQGAPAPLALKGKVIQIYRKQADGSWKIARDIFNNDMPVGSQFAALPLGRLPHDDQERIARTLLGRD